MGEILASLKEKQMIRNLTQHPVVIRNESGSVLATIPPDGSKALVAETNESAGTVEVDDVDVSVERKSFGEVTGLPELAPGDYAIVSLLTALTAKAAGRDVSQLLVPGRQTRDEHGTVNGCLSLATLDDDDMLDPANFDTVNEIYEFIGGVQVSFRNRNADGTYSAAAILAALERGLTVIERLRAVRRWIAAHNPR